jgi:hypothetical protein
MVILQTWLEKNISTKFEIKLYIVLNTLLLFSNLNTLFLLYLLVAHFRNRWFTLFYHENKNRLVSEITEHFMEIKAKSKCFDLHNFFLFFIFWLACVAVHFLITCWHLFIFSSYGLCLQGIAQSTENHVSWSGGH